MSDIVEKLRGFALTSLTPATMREAADTITTLRAEVERLRKLLWEVNEQCPEHVPLSLLAQIRAALAEEKKG